MKPSRFAVKAIVRNATGQCLFLSRSEVNKHYVGCWEWPGGKVDPGEDFAMAVVRETREELMSFLDCCRQPALDALKTFLAADCESTANPAVPELPGPLVLPPAAHAA